MSEESSSGMRWRRWPLLAVGLPAAVSTWTGWVGLGLMSGFGVVHPLPGIADAVTLNSAITLPVGVETYSAIALGVWLSRVPLTQRTRRFAAFSASLALSVGVAGQVIYHLLTAWGYQRAPVAVVVFVACLPMLVLGAAAALFHMLRADHTEMAKQAVAEAGVEQRGLAPVDDFEAEPLPPARESKEADEVRPVESVTVAANTPAIVATADSDVLIELYTCKNKAAQLEVAWRELGVIGIPTTQDVRPAVQWLTDRGFRVDDSRAYSVRRQLAEQARVSQVRTERLAVVGGR